MKMTVGLYQIEIKAKRPHATDRNNAYDTIGFMNEMSIALRLAAEKRAEQGYQQLAADCKEMSDNIYDALKKVGAYKEF